MSGLIMRWRLSRTRVGELALGGGTLLSLACLHTVTMRSVQAEKPQSRMFKNPGSNGGALATDPGDKFGGQTIKL